MNLEVFIGGEYIKCELVQLVVITFRCDLSATPVGVVQLQKYHRLLLFFVLFQSVVFRRHPCNGFMIPYHIVLQFSH